jgi:hypothetical protein
MKISLEHEQQEELNEGPLRKGFSGELMIHLGGTYTRQKQQRRDKRGTLIRNIRLVLVTI